MKKTKIEKLETILWDRWLLLKIYCEDGTVGIGEAGVHGWQRPTKSMIETMEPYLIGKDPSLIEHHYQWLYRSSHFMGSIVQGALSAIDIALWDIKLKGTMCQFMNCFQVKLEKKLDVICMLECITLN